MTCPNQIIIKNKSTGEWITIPCNKKGCTACDQRKIDRLQMETGLYTRYENVTSINTLLLTVADEHQTINEENGKWELNKKQVDTFKRIAKQFQRREWIKTKKKIETFNLLHPNHKRQIPEYKEVKFEIAGEYSPDSKRPHYHGLMLNATTELIKHLTKKLVYNKYGNVMYLTPLWPHGMIGVKNAMGKPEAALRYITKYITKAGSIAYTTANNLQKEFFSKPRGLTKKYLSLLEAYHKDRLTSQIKVGYKSNGQPKFRNMTRLMRKQIFTPGENEEITKQLIEKSTTAIEAQLQEIRQEGYTNPEQQLRIREQHKAKMIKKKFHTRKQHA
ncbi:MAG: putative replication initiation protein [Microviridae sp.]|nr:MAG: putative replication initiation protein [Microviridae sp.]